ncbi:type III pantothenate kinase [Halobacteriovorax sp. DPLXC-1]|uniref:type III pantothenate kinase n=1 Tax=Halobacteriovorax sp. DPLXC-1 TaxID=3110771 RepID=UPI002FF0B600
MPTYTIDSGNTFIKVAKFENNILSKITRYTPEDFNPTFQKDEKIIFSNVSKNIIHKLPSSAIAAAGLIEDFKSTYDQSTFGVDRKIISHYLQKKFPNENILIIDAGSFITFDYIESGIHRGGPIYLGLGNYLKAYPAFSQNLPLVDNVKAGECANTKEAISTAFTQYLSMIKNEIQKFQTDQVIVTGGDARNFQDCADEQGDLMHHALFELSRDFDSSVLLPIT